MTKNYRIIAELVVSALGKGTSLSKYIREVKKEIDAYPNIRTLTHPMGTIIEANSLEDILTHVYSSYQSYPRLAKCD